MNVRVSGLSLLGLVLLGGVVIGGCGSENASDALPTQDTTSPEAVTSRFLHWYASERNLGRDPITSGSLDANGDVAMPFNTDGMYRGWVDKDCKVHIAILRGE